MSTIRMTTRIEAPVERVFELARSLDLETEAVARWRLRPTGGVTGGQISAGERVTWQGRRLGRMREHTIAIAEMRAPFFFREVMEKGGFRVYEHDHHFAPMNDGTRMRDEVRYELRWGPLAGLTGRSVRRRLLKMLEARSEALRVAAEGAGWTRYLEKVPEEPVIEEAGKVTA